MSTTPATPAAAAIEAFARGGMDIDPAVLDVHLAEIADKAACSLLRDRHREDYPAAANHELLSTVAALRAALGYSPTPTAREVMDWQEQQRTVWAAAQRGPLKPYPVRFVDGPYAGLEMLVDGPAEPYPADDDPLGHLAGDDGWIAGPPVSVPLNVAWGDTERPGYTNVLYGRGDGPDAEGMWAFRLRTDFPPPPEGARPHITVPAAQAG